MTENAAIVERVSKVLGVSPKELVRRSLEELLRSQLRTCFAEINEVKMKYEVEDASELGKKITEGTIAEHPAWEDFVLENLEERVHNIRKELVSLKHD
jgi:hypothetical protein